MPALGQVTIVYSSVTQEKTAFSLKKILGKLNDAIISAIAGFPPACQLSINNLELHWLGSSMNHKLPLI